MILCSCFNISTSNIREEDLAKIGTRCGKCLSEKQNSDGHFSCEIRQEELNRGIYI